MSKELWRVALNAYHSPEYGTSPKVIWQRVVDAISKELLREDEPDVWIVRAQNGMTRCILETEPDRKAFDLGETFLPRYPHPAPKVTEEDEPARWIEGAPKSPWADEWFIAVTTYGDRVVLIALPEDYSYDFKTADDTYIKRDKIQKWMQFPDSEYLRPAPKVPAGMVMVPKSVITHLIDQIDRCHYIDDNGHMLQNNKAVIDLLLAAAPKGE